MSPRPRRIQRKRTKGWRLPAGAICVTRPGPWGNPYIPANPDIHGRRCCVEAYRSALAAPLFSPEWAYSRIVWQSRHLDELRGHDLACWCPLPEPGEPDYCHAAVLLERANRP